MTDALKLRNALNWTQSEMAEYLGVSQAHVSRIEAGATPSRAVQKHLDALERQFMRPPPAPEVALADGAPS